MGFFVLKSMKIRKTNQQFFYLEDFIIRCFLKSLVFKRWNFFFNCHTCFSRVKRGAHVAVETAEATVCSDWMHLLTISINIYNGKFIISKLEKAQCLLKKSLRALYQLSLKDRSQIKYVFSYAFKGICSHVNLVYHICSYIDALKTGNLFAKIE